MECSNNINLKMQFLWSIKNDSETKNPINKPINTPESQAEYKISLNRKNLELYKISTIQKFCKKMLIHITDDKKIITLLVQLRVHLESIQVYLGHALKIDPGLIKPTKNILKRWSHPVDCKASTECWIHARGLKMTTDVLHRLTSPDPWNNFLNTLNS